MKPTITKLDIERYVGRWYEIARLPFKWETNQKTATADYTWDGSRLGITNTGLNEIRPGVLMVADIRKGHGWIPDVRYPGKMKVKFDDGRPADPEGNYLIHWTDYDNFSFVGGGNEQMPLLWVLSRRPYITESERDFILETTRSFGYSSDKLIAYEHVLV